MFTNYHLAITKEEYKQRQYDLESNLTIRKIRPDFSTFLKLLKRVGSPWGWDRRPKYFADMGDLKSRVYDKNSGIFLLQAFNETVGYCFTVKRPDLTSTFNKYAVAEIENFGLFPEYTGKGYGRTFLPLVFNQLFKGNDIVYLTTRSTNHSKVVPFYISLGMQVIDTEYLEDDLKPDGPTPIQ